MEDVLFRQLAVALGLSSLIGLERERRSQEGHFNSFGGVRTFALIGVLGALAFHFSAMLPGFFPTVTAGFLALVVAGYVMTSRTGENIGATSEISAILVYIIGVLSGMEEYLVASTIAIGLLAVAHFKDPLHHLAKSLKNEEIVSTLQFLLIALVILPLLPNESFGPYDFFNPYVIWLMVVFVSGISFASYIAIKVFGTKRGITLSGFLSGFISTTALTFSFAEQSKKFKKIVNPFVLGLLIATTALFFRVGIEVFVLNKGLFYVLIWPLLAMSILGFVLSLWFWQKKEDVPGSVQEETLKLDSPFKLAPALKFALIFAAVLFVIKFFASNLDQNWLYLVSLLVGLLDVDSITLSMARESGLGIEERVAALTVLLAVFSNTLGKIGIFMFLGNKKVALGLFYVFMPLIFVGSLVLALL